MIDVYCVQLLQTGGGSAEGAAIFNYFFSLVLYFGLIAFGLRLIVRVLSRS